MINSYMQEDPPHPHVASHVYAGLPLDTIHDDEDDDDDDDDREPTETVLGDSFLFSAIPIAHPLAKSGNIWQHLATFGNIGNIWQHLATFGNIWQHLATLATLTTKPGTTRIQVCGNRVRLR